MAVPERANSTDFRLTPQRRAILEAVRETACHPDAAWVYERVRRSLPNISLGTVYRNLGLLAQEGLIRELALDDQVSHWDGWIEPHDHIVCIHCGKVANVEVAALSDAIDGEAEHAAGYRVLGYRLCLQGICPECQAGGKS